LNNAPAAKKKTTSNEILNEQLNKLICGNFCWARLTIELNLDVVEKLGNYKSDQIKALLMFLCKKNYLLREI